ncbi:hypothetical protein [Ruminococcus flavefaciens]|uniref:Uncharacterized protein n=1 Tax=Ruminococcus flavefaciens TaxID=1265 RepID=A0A315Y4A2_RUMFL|nr:hypothetical protein [Ruminococcus flavefaciens]PWJ14609.1 hypothetical protein IE37_00594 [Ruminococcus flavefaciens]SSA42639.1 hypothetical protein SAMN02910325_00594 [Ruminococcus flavefaciens]
MMTNREGCTIYEKIVDPQTRSAAYVRHRVGALFVEDERGIGTGADRASSDEVFLSIPAASSSYLPKKDDRVALYITDAAEPPKDALTITYIGDFRHGSAAVQHIEVTAR